MDVLRPHRSPRRSRLKAELPRGALRPGRHRRARRAQLRPLATRRADQPQRGRRAARLHRARATRSCSGPGSRTPRRWPIRSPASFPRWPRRRARSARRRSATAARSAATSAPARPPVTRCRRSSSRMPRCASRASGVSGACPLGEFLLGVKRNALAPDELVVSVRMTPSRAPQTFMKVGPRNAMVISVCSLALEVDRERGEIRAAFGSAAPDRPSRHRPARRGRRASRARVAEAASPIDDVRGTAAYRRHALGVLTGRALERCLA